MRFSTGPELRVIESGVQRMDTVFETKPVLHTPSQVWRSARTATVIATLLVLTALAVVVATGWGAVGVDWTHIVGIAARRGLGIDLGLTWTPAEEAIVWQLRLPRVLGALMVGAALSVAGVIFQGLLRNPMADPYLLGTSGGAALAATVAFLVPLQFGLMFNGIVPVAAFLGALTAVLLVYRIARIGPQTPITTLLLAGFAASSLMASGMSFLMFVNRNTLERVVMWTMGSISTAGWSQLAAVLPLLVVGCLAAYALAAPLNAFLLGEESAAALGIEVERHKFLLLVTGALLTGAAVALSGLVGFVGLVVPHITRLSLGPDHRRLLPASALLGGMLLVLADLFARVVMAPAEIPLGIVTALIGAPFFIYLLRRHRQQYMGPEGP